MIKLLFSFQREVFTVSVEGRNIYYLDRKLKGMVRLVPIDKNLEREIRLSRNKLPAYLMNIFNLTKEEQEEYDKANNEDELAEICIRDCKKNGAIFQKRL